MGRERGQRRIAILGGGMAGLTAAFELTATPALRERHRVTLYQPGFRLGGKGASGRNQRAGMRIEEHGLHVWGGYYENAFHVIRRCYEELGRRPGEPLATFGEAFQRKSFLTLAERVRGEAGAPGLVRGARSSERALALDDGSRGLGADAGPPALARAGLARARLDRAADDPLGIRAAAQHVGGHEPRDPVGGLSARLGGERRLLLRSPARPARRNGRLGAREDRGLRMAPGSRRAVMAEDRRGDRLELDRGRRRRKRRRAARRSLRAGEREPVGSLCPVAAGIQPISPGAGRLGLRRPGPRGRLGRHEL